MHLSQPDPPKAVQQRGQEHTIRPGDPRSVDGSLQDRELVAQRQDLDVLVGAAHR
jgi:hypothetical protein